uniref:CAAX prenyl protease 2 n=1 Tax=Oryzias latipes TaxID=8090 RepID=A0A3P9MCV2_ORYLA
MMEGDFSPHRLTEPMQSGSAVPDGLCWVSVLSCLLLACSYVGSLYVWKSDLPRDHPTVIKRRFTSVLVVSGLSPLFVWAWRELTAVRTSASLLALMGIRLEGIVPAIVFPLLLTMVLFLGPLMQLAIDCPWTFTDGVKVALDPCFWSLCVSDMRWLRNQVVAPLTEELVFRACMLPMLVPCAGPATAIFTCPLFFGVAHFHHVIELLRFRQGTLAGIFLSAGHLMGPVLCHSFCNYMGFPAISTALEHPQRLTILCSYLLGVLLFLFFLFPFTDPSFYGFPTPVCTLAPSASSLCFS